MFASKNVVVKKMFSLYNYRILCILLMWPIQWVGLMVLGMLSWKRTTTTLTD